MSRPEAPPAQEFVMAKQHSEHVLDKRILERNLKKGLITDKELKDHLAKLPDVTERAEPIKVQLQALPESEA